MPVATCNCHRTACRMAMPLRTVSCHGQRPAARSCFEVFTDFPPPDFPAAGRPTASRTRSRVSALRSQSQLQCAERATARGMMAGMALAFVTATQMRWGFVLVAACMWHAPAAVHGGRPAAAAVPSCDGASDCEYLGTCASASGGAGLEKECHVSRSTPAGSHTRLRNDPMHPSTHLHVVHVPAEVAECPLAGGMRTPLHRGTPAVHTSILLAAAL